MRWLHNPCGIHMPAELLDKNVVIARENVSLRDDIHMNESPLIVLLSNWIVFTFEVLPVALDVFDQEIFLAQLF